MPERPSPKEFSQENPDLSAERLPVIAKLYPEALELFKGYQEELMERKPKPRVFIEDHQGLWHQRVAFESEPSKLEWPNINVNKADVLAIELRNQDDSPADVNSHDYIFVELLLESSSKPISLKRVSFENKFQRLYHVILGREFPPALLNDFYLHEKPYDKPESLNLREVINKSEKYELSDEEAKELLPFLETPRTPLAEYYE